MSKETVKRARRVVKAMQPTTDIAGSEMILPNTSGDHVRSIKRDVPVADADLANKKYVDDGLGAHSFQECYNAEWGVDPRSILVNNGDILFTLAINQQVKFKKTAVNAAVQFLDESNNIVLEVPGSATGPGFPSAVIKTRDWIPFLDDTYDLGAIGTSDERRWRNAYFSGVVYQGLKGSETLKIEDTGNVFMQELDVNTHKILNVVDPVGNQDAATKKYVDDKHVAAGSDTYIQYRAGGGVFAGDAQLTWEYVNHQLTITQTDGAAANKLDPFVLTGGTPADGFFSAYSAGDMVITCGDGSNDGAATVPGGDGGSITLTLGAHGTGGADGADGQLTVMGGNVGIGTLTPATALDVVGDITVSGLVDGIDIATDVAANTTHRGSDGSDHSFIDQAVTLAATPTFGKFKITPLGGMAIQLTNKTGDDSVAGDIVIASTATADAVEWAGGNETMAVGVFLETGIADGDEAWVVVSGIADVHMDAGGSGVGDRIICSGTARRGDVDNNPNAAAHFREIGHCIEIAAANENARIVLHFL